MAGDMKLSLLADTILLAGIATRVQLINAEFKTVFNNKGLLYNLVLLEYVNESALLEKLSESLKLPVYDLNNFKLSDKLRSIVNTSYLLDHRVLPISKHGQELIVAMEDPTDLILLENLKSETGLTIQPVITSPKLLYLQLGVAQMHHADDFDSVEQLNKMGYIKRNKPQSTPPAKPRFKFDLEQSDDNERSVSLSGLEDDGSSGDYSDDGSEPEAGHDFEDTSSDIDFDSTMMGLPAADDADSEPEPEILAPVSSRVSASEEKPRYIRFPVHYATDRAPDHDITDSKIYYTGKRNALNALSYGRCLVSIPLGDRHSIGHIERPSWLKLQFSENPEIHMTILELATFEPDAFYKEVDAFLSNADDDSVLVFVHGYNVSFQEAILRTAQVAYDLDFGGLAVSYSWPSTGTVKGYLTDANNARWSQPHFKDFINDLRARTGINKMHIIAHSMGSRVLAGALEDVAGDLVSEQVIFAAPDIDADVFKELTGGFHHKVRRITLYASSNDEALKLSRKLQGGYARAGEVASGVHVYPNVDSIDATHVNTGLLKHSYFSDNRSIVSDIYHLIRQDMPPDKRFGMSERKNGRGYKYWEFKP